MAVSHADKDLAFSNYRRGEINRAPSRVDPRKRERRAQRRWADPMMSRTPHKHWPFAVQPLCARASPAQSHPLHGVPMFTRIVLRYDFNNIVSWLKDGGINIRTPGYFTYALRSQSTKPAHLAASNQL